MQPSGLNDTTATAEYTLVINGKPEGPFSIAELKSRGIKPGDFIKTPQMDDYKEAHEVAELRQLFGFSKQPIPLQYFGSFDQRLLATAIDWFIVSGGFIILAFIGVASTQDQMTRYIITGIALVIIPIAKFIYHVVMESSAKQATIGKQLLRIRVCDLFGDRITTGTAITRHVAKLLSLAPLFIGYIIAFFTKQQQCLHDMIAGTLITKDRLD